MHCTKRCGRKAIPHLNICPACAWDVVVEQEQSIDLEVFKPRLVGLRPGSKVRLKGAPVAGFDEELEVWSFQIAIRVGKHGAFTQVTTPTTNDGLSIVKIDSLDRTKTYTWLAGIADDLEEGWE